MNNKTVDELLHELIKKCEYNKELMDKIDVYLGCLWVLGENGLVSYKITKITRQIDVYRIFACAWHSGRLKTLCSLSDDEFADLVNRHPVGVIGYTDREGKLFYSIHDGNHRVICARIRGWKTIKADISTIYGKLTIPIYYYNDMLWYPHKGKYFALLNAKREDIPLLETLFYIVGSKLIVIQP